MNYYHDEVAGVVVCPSVRPSVCLSVFCLSGYAILLPGKWLVPHQTVTRWSPGMSPSRLCSRSRSRSRMRSKGSRDMDTLVISLMSILLVSKWPVPDQSCIQGARCSRDISFYYYYRERSGRAVYNRRSLFEYNDGIWTTRKMQLLRCDSHFAKRQSARMSKINNDGLTRSGTGCCTHTATVGVKGLMWLTKMCQKWLTLKTENER